MVGMSPVGTDPVGAGPSASGPSGSALIASAQGAGALIAQYTAPAALTGAAVASGQLVSKFATFSEWWSTRSLVLSNQGRTIIGAGYALSTDVKMTGKWYFEIYVDNFDTEVGVGATVPVLQDISNKPLGEYGCGFSYYGSTGAAYSNDGSPSSGGTSHENGMGHPGTFGTGGYVGFELDIDNATLTIINASGRYDAPSGWIAASKLYAPVVVTVGASSKVTLNCGQAPFHYTPTAGFKAWTSTSLSKSGRYWRVAQGQGVEERSMVVAEVQQRLTIGGANQIGSGTISASSAEPSFPVTNAIDGNAATIFASLWNSPLYDWIQYDYGVGVSKAIRELAYTVRGDSQTSGNPVCLMVSYSDNGTDFYPAAAFPALSWSNGETKALNWVDPIEGRLDAGASAAGALVGIGAGPQPATLAGSATSAGALVGVAQTTAAATLSGAAALTTSYAAVTVGVNRAALTSAGQATSALVGFSFKIDSGRIRLAAAQGAGTLVGNQIVSARIAPGASPPVSAGVLVGSVVRSGALAGSAASTAALVGQFFQTGALAGSVTSTAALAGALGPSPGVLSGTASATTVIASSGLKPAVVEATLAATAQLVGAQTRAAPITATAVGSGALVGTAVQERALVAAPTSTAALIGSSTAVTTLAAAGVLTPALVGAGRMAGTLQGAGVVTTSIVPAGTAAATLHATVSADTQYYTTGIFAEPLSAPAQADALFEGAATFRGQIAWGGSCVTGGFVGMRIGHFAPDERVLLGDGSKLADRTLQVEPSDRVMVA